MVYFQNAQSVSKAVKLHEKVLKENELSVTTSVQEENPDQFVAVFVTGLTQGKILKAIKEQYFL